MLAVGVQQPSHAKNASFRAFWAHCETSAYQRRVWGELSNSRTGPRIPNTSSSQGPSLLLTRDSVRQRALHQGCRFELQQCARPHTETSAGARESNRQALTSTYSNTGGQNLDYIPKAPVEAQFLNLFTSVFLY